MKRVTKNNYKIRILALLAFGSLWLLSTPAMSKVNTNQEMIESLSSYDKLDNTDVDAVLKTVIDHTPEQITVYPTEGYYYFWFYHQGNVIRGNLRFSHKLIDKGQVSLAYYYDIEGKGGQGSEVYYKRYSAADGLVLTKTADRQYQLSFDGSKKAVTLNIPTSDYQPVTDEAFLGNMQDESGVVFTLVFNHQLKQFYYLLDESQSYEYYYDSSPHVSVGARTGFVYFHDNNRAQPRKILVGIASRNSALNNFYDGPFDQLPDHSLGQTAFKEYAESVYPSVKGNIDKHGHFLDQENTRLVINNYVYYKDLTVFKYLEQCRNQSLSCVQNFINLSKR